MYVNDLVVGQLLSLVLICCLNAVPDKVRTGYPGLYRLLSAAAGLSVGLFYCGRSAVLLFVSGCVACLLLNLNTGGRGAGAAITWQFIFLTGSHLLSSRFPDGSYVNKKVIMPLMMLTQKVADLALMQHDGDYKTTLTPDMATGQVQVLSHKQSVLLAQLGYIFSAPGLLAGPLYRFTEYEALPRKPVPKALVLSKVLTAAMFFSVRSATGAAFPLHRNGDHEFVESTPFLNRVLYLWISSCLARLNYYWLWSLSEALCNAAGMGYTERDGRGCWDALSDYSFFTLELSTDVANFTRNWNKTTSAWLKRLVYYRFSRMRTVLTFLVSAWWHGLHPGIFLGFSIWAAVVIADRKVAKFDLQSRLPSGMWRFLHICLSWLTTQLAVGFILTTIQLQNFRRILIFWSSMYYSLPLGALFCLLLPA